MTILPKRHIVFVVLSALFLAAAAIGTYVYVTYEPGCSCQLPGPQLTVMKAKGDIPAGSVLTDDMAVWEGVPERFLQPNYIGEADAELTLGSIVQVDLHDGVMILKSDVIESMAPPRATPRGLEPELPTPEPSMPETEL